MRTEMNAETALPVCPCCQIEIEDDNSPIYETEDVYLYMYRSGTCPWCKRVYKWTETYEWNQKFYDFQEV